MRLPRFFTEIAPVGQTLTALEQGGAELEDQTRRHNRQLWVSTGEEGLSLWEADYGLSDGTGSDPAVRRGLIRAAITGGATLTVARLKEMAVTVGGADRGEVEEDFARGRVCLSACFLDRPPQSLTALREAVARQKPAHLTVEVVPVTVVRGAVRGSYTLLGKAHLVVRGTQREIEEE